MAQSTSSALPPLAMASFAVASRSARRWAGAATRSGTTARSRGSSRASASIVRRVCWPSGSASASSWRDRRRRRRPRASVPPSGPQSSSAAVGSSRWAWFKRAAEQHQQRAGAGLLGQRQLVPGHRDRHVGRGQRPAQQRHLPGGRADQDGHVRPGHAVGQVGAAQRVGDQRGLLGRAVRDQDADLAGRALRRGHQQPVPGLGGAGPWRGREPPGHPAGRGQQVAAAAAAGAQRHHRRRLAVRGAEPVRELGERAHVGAAERVDGLVRVADRDQLPAVPGQRHQQRLLRRVAVLVLVDQHHVVGAALALPGLLAAEQGGGDADDLGVVVGRDRREVEAGRVPVEEPGGGHPVVAVLVLAQLAQAAAVQAALGRAQQQVAHLLGEAAGGQGRPAAAPASGRRRPGPRRSASGGPPAAARARRAAAAARRRPARTRAGPARRRSCGRSPPAARGWCGAAGR